MVRGIFKVAKGDVTAMAKPSPQALGLEIGNQLIALLESGIRGMNKEDRRIVLRLLSTRLALYFLERRL